MKASTLKRVLVILSIVAGIVLALHVLFYFWIQSLSYHWDESGFVGKKLDTIEPFLDGEKIDFCVKGFIEHVVKKHDLIYAIELGGYDCYDDPKIIKRVSNKIMFQPDYLGEIRFFSKKRFSGHGRDGEEIMMRILWCRLEIFTPVGASFKEQEWKKYCW
ncbi:MAG: hypothetical protein LBQ75_08215 [Zoogloeaceae bacterium]|jgi:hypothetical protein|nr:hypothetical protein [Zoogloeaceae bacterium]